MSNIWSLSVVSALAVLPWLTFYTAGPSTTLWPLILSAACAIVLCLLRSLLTARLAALSWLVAGFASALMGLVQYFGIAGLFEPWVSSASAGQAYGNLRQRNQFAGLTNIGLAAGVWLAGSLRTLWVGWAAKQSVAAAPVARSAASWFLRRLLMCCIGISVLLLAAGNAASASRTGLLQLVILCALAWMWGLFKHRDVLDLTVLAIVTYALSALALPWLAGLDAAGSGVFARLQAGDEVCASRLTLWSNVMHLIAQKPWLGWGWGELDYAHYSTLYEGPRFCDILDNAHNLPLHLAVELGLPLALAFSLALLRWVWHLRPWQESNPTRQLAFSVLALIALHSLLEYPLWYGPFQMAVGLCLLMLWRTRQVPYEKRTPENTVSNQPRALYTTAITATVFIAISGLLSYVAWDYLRISQIYLAPEQRIAAYKEDTLRKIQDSRLFSDQVTFAELLLTPLTPENAGWTFETASALLHFSPEPRVIERVIESAVMLGRDDDALFHLARYRAAFPDQHRRWAAANALTR